VYRSARVLVVLVVCLLTGLPALAYTDPPDPLWISGYWDDGDFDGVVVFILGTCAVPVDAPASPGPLWEPGRVELAAPGVVPAPVGSESSSRAPPVAPALSS
jgi:hypothetical protein